MANILNLTIQIILAVTITVSKEVELPLCPTTVPFFPQALPMHCRMPAPNMNSFKPEAPFFPPVPNEITNALPFPVPPGMMVPGFPGMVPPGFPGILPPGLPAIPFNISFTVSPLSGTPPPNLAVPMPPVPPAKLPVIVMPFYSRTPQFKNIQNKQKFPMKGKRRRRHRRHKSDTSSSSDTSSDTSSSRSSDTSSESSSDTESDRGWWRPREKLVRGGNGKKRRHKRRKHNGVMRRSNIPEVEGRRNGLFTPVLQYVTKDGYVIFEKKISKGEAKDWLGVSTSNPSNNEREPTRHQEIAPKSHDVEDFMSDNMGFSIEHPNRLNKVNKEIKPTHIQTNSKKNNKRRPTR